MISPAATTRRSDSTRKLARRCTILTAVELATFLAVGGVLAQSSVPSGWTAAAAAAGLCWVGSIIALVLTGVCRAPGVAVQALLLGIFTRTGVPLAGGLALSFQSPALSQGGLMPALLVCYLVTLVVETGLSLGLVAGPRAAVTAAATHGMSVQP